MRKPRRFLLLVSDMMSRIQPTTFSLHRETNPDKKKSIYFTKFFFYCVILYK